MTKSPVISLRSQWLGEKLRVARERAGCTLRDAGTNLQMDHTSLGRFERGTHRIRKLYVKELVDFYGIDDTRERDMLIELSKEAWRKDWWDGDDEGLETGFIDFTWLESRADQIYVYEPLVVNGLLQTPGYAQALQDVQYGNKDNPHARSTAEIRSVRQQILQGERPTGLSVIVEEPAIRHRVGSTEINRAQVRHLISMAQKPNVEIRLIRENADGCPGHYGPFTLFRMPDPYPEIGYIENHAGRTFLEKPNKVDRMRRTYDELAAQALSPTATIRFLREVQKVLS